jgi:mRNA deadenylase 3'-5' endonuclease subunit Ccr4
MSIYENDLIMEAFIALIEKKNEEIEELAYTNEFYFRLWTELMDHIGKEGGRKVIYKALELLDDEYKDKIEAYINENFDS